MGYYDIYPPLVKLNRTFSLDEMRTPDDRRAAAARKRLSALFAASSLKPWMDPRPRPNKQSGAYMNGVGL